MPLLASTRQSQNITVVATASGLARAVGHAWYRIGQACCVDRGAHGVPRLCHSMSAHRIRDDTGWSCRDPARRLARVAVVRGKAYHNRALLRLSAMISQYFTWRDSAFLLSAPQREIMATLAVFDCRMTNDSASMSSTIPA